MNATLSCLAPAPSTLSAGAKAASLLRTSPLVSSTGFEDDSGSDGLSVISCRNGEVYEIDRRIASGGLGVVYRARRAKDGRAVALKLPKSRHDPACSRLLRHEAEVHSALNHPHIVDVIDHGESTDGIPYIAMSLLEGMTLDRLIASAGPLSLSRAAGICLQVAEAIAYAHARGIVHRDIKPANIMVSQVGGRDFVHVLDFGISDRESARQEQKTTSGSICYMAPEQVTGKPYTRQSDVYQLALVLFECLAGSLPFDIAFAPAVLYRICGEVLGEKPNPFIAGLPGQILSILRRGLAREQGERFAGMDEFAAELAVCLEPDSAPACPAVAGRPASARRPAPALPPFVAGIRLEDRVALSAHPGG